MKLAVETDRAGRLSIAIGNLSLHLLPKRSENRFWGYRTDDYEHIDLYDFGLGPIALITWWRVAL